MPYYQRRGQVPHKRHTQFRQPDGSLYAEELISTEGFSSVYSLAYHVHPPTLVRQPGTPVDVAPAIAAEANMQHRAFLGFQVEPAADYWASRHTLLLNEDVAFTLAAPTASMTDYFYKNAGADELIFIHRGSGRLKTAFGEIPFAYGDYLHVPRGVIYQLTFDDADNRLLIIESGSPLEFPRRYRNEHGQLLEHSPFCERDIRPPENLQTLDETGDFRVRIKRFHKLYEYVYATHPFDFVGWDGCFYPYALSIHDFEPITGRVHQPPPVHQTFAGRGFVVCSFVPRLFDYHPQSVPAPYNHSNVDSDEVLYYVDGDFMSRKRVEAGMLSLHPMGIPHGPHPGTVEKSLGAQSTEELAVMLDTFRPLQLTQAAMAVEMPDYHASWMEAAQGE